MTRSFKKGADMFTFKRWGRKSYSLFNSLKRQVRIGVLLAVYTTVAHPEYVFGQADTSRVNMKVDLDEVEVSAQRAPVAFPQVARMVSVIGKDEIEAAPVQSIQELLEYALSVDVRQRGSNGVQADISVRGGSFDQTLILLNGINISDPQTGHHSLDLPVSIKNIDRIEILEGPAARVFGPNAFSGVINIITTPEDDPGVKADVSGGQHKLTDLNGSVHLKSGKLSQFAAVSRHSSAGYIDNTDFKIWNAFYESKLKTKPGSFDFQIGRTNKDFGANSFYTAIYPNQFEATKTTFASLKFESGKKIHLTPSVYWRRHQDRFELFRDHPASWYTGHNYHLTDVFGSSLNAWFASRLGKTALGAEIRSENIWSNVLGNPLAEPVSVPRESGQYFTKSYSRTTVSYFAEHSVYLDKWTFSAGAMANRISDLGLGWNIYPGVDASYLIAGNLKIYGSYGQSLRMPTFTDLFYNGPTNVGNPNLKPEKATNFEGGLKYNQPGFTGSADLYYRKGKDLIDWIRQNESDKWHTQNLTRINTTGIEFSSIIYPEKLWNRPFPLIRIGLNYSYTELNKGTNNFFSYYVLDNLKHKLDFDVTHKMGRRLTGSWRVSYQERNGMRTNAEAYKPFWLVNTKISWKVNAAEIYAMASNLFNTTYYDLGPVEQPGRWISIGMSFSMGFK
jgi:iron complex outermembrane receptor protein